MIHAVPAWWVVQENPSFLSRRGLIWFRSKELFDQRSQTSRHHPRRLVMQLKAMTPRAFTAPGFHPAGLWVAMNTPAKLPSTSAQAVPWRMELSRGSESSVHALAVARLLAEAFSEGEDALQQPTLPQQLAYQLRLATATQWQAVRQGARFATALAFDSSGLVGVCQVAPGLAVPGAGEHQPPQPASSGSSVAVAAGVMATISNMAVAASVRRQGLGGELLQRCEAAALEANPALAILVLAAYQDNSPALSLYERSGYSVDESWVDPEWLRSAERGQVGVKRRRLLIKRVGQ